MMAKWQQILEITADLTANCARTLRRSSILQSDIPCMVKPQLKSREYERVLYHNYMG